jgi:hypothetical protein
LPLIAFKKNIHRTMLPAHHLQHSMQRQRTPPIGRGSFKTGAELRSDTRPPASTIACPLVQ